MPFATGARGARIHFAVTDPGQGGGETVLLIQGLGLSSRFWFDLPRRLSHDGWRVLTLDNRGTGKSDAPRGPYRMRDMADDVAAVLEASRTPHAYVVGISMGGMIAQHVALRHAPRVRGLVLLATSCGLPHARLPRARMLAALVSLGASRRRRGIEGTALPHILLPKRHVSRAKELLADWPAALREHPLSPSAFFAQLAAVAGHATGFRLRKIRCPTVVVTGDDDSLVPPENAHAIARRIRGAHVEVVPDCGHGIPIMDERVVHRALARLRG